MMLINQIFNMHSNRFLYFLSCPNLYKWVKVDELLNIFHFQHNVDLNYIFKFSTFKYYSSIHQTYNEKVGVNSI